MRTLIHAAGALLVGFAAAQGVGYAMDYVAARPKRTVLELPSDAERVVVLTRATCPYCRRLVAWLEANRVRYTAYEVTDSADGVRLFAAIGERSVPVTIVDGRRIVGFRPAVLAEMIGLEHPVDPAR